MRPCWTLLVPALMVLAGCKEGIPPCSTQARGGCPRPVADDFVDGLRHLGRAEGDTFIETLDIVADGPIVYACTGTQGLTVWDATDGERPRLLAENVGPAGLAHGRFPRCQHVAIDADDDRLVMTNRGDEVQPEPWFAVYDISDPARPNLVDTQATEDSVEGAIIRDGTVIVAMHRGGVQVFDLDTRLERRGGYSDAMSDAWQPVLLDADTVAVAEAETGLRLYDLSNPDPTLLGTVALDGSSRDVVARDGLAFVATSAGIAAVDVADPAAPTVRSQVETVGTTLGIAFGIGDTVLTAEWDRMRGYDVSDPGAMTEILAEVVPTSSDFSRVLGLGTDPGEGRVYAGEWEGVHAYAQRAENVGPDLVPTPTALQYGRVAPGDDADQVLVLRNRGNRALTVFDVVGFPELTPDTTCLQVPPASSAAVEVRFSARNENPFDSFLRVCSDDPDQPEADVAVTANVDGVGVGDPVPFFDLRELNGGRYSSSTIEGSVTVLAYFATF